MLVDVFTSSLWLAGGGDRVTAAAVRALLGANHQVTLHTSRPVDLKVYTTLFDSDFTRVELKVHKCPLKRLSMAKGIGRYANLVCEFAVRNPMRGDVFVDLTAATCLGATYFRLPDIAYWNPPADFRVYLRQILNTPLRRALFTPFSVALTRLLDRMNEVPVHFVNSNYSETTIRKYYDGRLQARMYLLYPPVDISAWTPYAVADQRKGIISVARFSPWKRHDMQLEIVGNGFPLTMVGGARAPLETATVRELKRVETDNVQILVNLPIEKLRQLLWKTKVFLHTAESEPFGLSIVEAIAAGCVPVIRRSGGAAEVVPIQELTFAGPSEARSIVSKALAGDLDHYLPRLREHIRKFDESVFSSKFLAAVNQAGHLQSEADEPGKHLRQAH